MNQKTSSGNQYQPRNNDKKFITTVEQNSFDSKIENELLSKGLGEDFLFGSEKDLLLTNHSNDILNGGKGNDQPIGDADNDILTKGGGTDVIVFNSLDKELGIIKDLHEIINKIQINKDGCGFDIGIPEDGFSTKFNFDSSKGTLSYEGKEFLMINNDGSLEIPQILN